MTKHNYNIDVIKGMAVVSVILLHSLSTEKIFLIGAPYHIWQTVPIFMMITGFNTANSYKRRGYQSLNEIYNVRHFAKKINGIAIPFIIVWIVEFILQIIINGKMTILEALTNFITGGWGPGSYYMPIIIQAFFIIPVIYLVVKKSSKYSLIILLVVSSLFEVAAMNLPDEVYRIVIIRYIFAISLGVWLSFNKDNINWKLFVPLTLISFIYITGVNYFELNLLVENKGWLSQHVPSYFWTMFLIVIGLKFEIAENKSTKFLMNLGTASFNIFLVQMFYFWLFGGMFSELPTILYIIVSLIFCIVGGLVFYNVENYFREKISVLSTSI